MILLNLKQIMKKTILFILFLTIITPFWAQETIYRLLVGTYTDSGKSEGIYAYDINVKNDKVVLKSIAKGVQNPSYLALSTDKKFIYSVNQNETASSVSAFQFDDKTSKLTFSNKVDAKGAGPCFITVTDKHVFTANYTSGSISVFGRKRDGTLTQALKVIQHAGKSINSERQNEPHVHQVLLTPDKKYLLANDLGTDKTTVYQYQPNSTNILTPYDTLSIKPGSGPRHSAFSKDGKRLYLLQEIDGTVSVIGMKNGKLTLIQETSVVKNNKVVIRAADIHLSPDGQYLYASNRGTANDISCFSIAKNGKLTFLQQISTEGEGPRNFAITLNGQYVFVAHEQSNNIAIFKRDILTGLLSYTGKKIEVGSPVCLLFY